MAEKTGIAWCDATINFWHGCQKVSEGCKYCYMFRDKERWHQDGSQVVRSKPSTIKSTLTKLYHEQASLEKPLKIFTCSWSDFFIEQADNWREEAWNVIRDNKSFVWIILTKRPERIVECLPKDWGEGWEHVWLLVSAENQQRWNERVPILLQTPAKVRGVSIEPMIGPVDIVPNPTFGHLFPKLDWIIVGGESGNETGKWRYRPAQLKWFNSIVSSCQEQKIPVFVKQLGTFLGKQLCHKSRSGDDISEFPCSIAIQQFPNDNQRI